MEWDGCREFAFCRSLLKQSEGLTKGYGIGVGGISLQENLARLRAIAGADDAALLEDIDHAGGAGVAEAEAALEQGGAAFLLLAGDLDALDDEFLVGGGSALGSRV